MIYLVVGNVCCELFGRSGQEIWLSPGYLKVCMFKERICDRGPSGLHDPEYNKRYY